MPITILDCSCHHPFQERAFGRGKRAHNMNKEGQWRCTVCGALKGVASKEIKATVQKKEKAKK